MQDAPTPLSIDDLDWINDLPLETVAAIAVIATAAVAEKKRAEEERLWQQFKEQAEKLGIDLTNVAATKVGRSLKPKKYRGPNGEEWNGRGLGMPPWLKELVDAGRDKDEFINPEWAKSKGMVD